MASSIPPILVQLQADVSQLKAGMAQAEASLKGLDGTVAATSNKMNSFVGNLKRVGAAMGATFAATQITSFAKESIMAASNLNEALSKVGVVFGKNSGEIEKWAAGATANFGMSERGALTAVGTFGNLFDAFGLGEEDTKKFSKSLTELAVDMASFNDMSVDDAMNALRSGLSGETEPMKKFGSVLSETRLKTEALSLGLISNTKEALDPAAKAQAAYSLIMKDTARQQGDYDRTAGGTANTMRRVSAEMDNAKVAIGQGLLPIFDGLLKVLEKGILPVLNKLGKFLKDNSTEVAVFGAVLATGAVAWGVYTLAVNAATIATKVWTAVTKANPIGLIITAVALLAAGIVALWKRSETFRDVVISVAKVAIKAFASIIPMVGQVFEAIMKIATGPLRIFLSALSHLPKVGKYAKSALDMINGGLDGISDFADGAAKKANGLIDTLDKVGKQASETADKVDTATGGIKDKEAGKGKGNSDADEKLAKAAAKAKAAAEKQQKQLDKLIDSASDKRLDIIKDYEQKKLDIEEAYQERTNDILDSYNTRKQEMEADHQEKLADIQQNYTDKTNDAYKNAADKRQNIIEQSMAVMTGAFANATKVDLGKLFIYGGGAGGLVTQLKGSLEDAKKLQSAAGRLAAAGYSQEFINEVIAQGPMQGTAMADSILNASPENQKAIKDLYSKVKTTSETGLDALAKQMNDGTNFATSALAKAYAQVGVDLQIQLAKNAEELNKANIAQNEIFDKAMAKAKAALDKALLEAKLTRDKDLAKAQKAFSEAILEAEKAFLKSAKEINTKTQAQLDALLAKAIAVKKALEDLEKTSFTGNNKTSTSSISPTSNSNLLSTNSVTNISYNMPINVEGTNAKPIDLQNAAMLGVKYGTPITVSGVY
jgi:hypothetical protein